MNKVLTTYLRKFALVFFDDILIYRSTLLEHRQHLAKILRVLRDNKLFAKRRKCEFAQQSIEYLGHIISANGVANDPVKVLGTKSK
jgi:hypothetical protein